MKMEFNWVKDIRVADIEEIVPTDPKKRFHQRKLFISTGKEFYTIILNGTFKENLEILIANKEGSLQGSPDTIKEKPKKKTNKK